MQVCRLRTVPLALLIKKSECECGVPEALWPRPPTPRAVVSVAWRHACRTGCLHPARGAAFIPLTVSHLHPVCDHHLGSYSLNICEILFNV